VPNTKAELTLEDLDDISDFDIESFLRTKKLIQDRPWTLDIIRVLSKRPKGLSNQQLYRELKAIRDPTTLPKPQEFEASVRSALNGHNPKSSRWNGKEVDALFYQPNGRGTWAVRPEKIIPWLKAHKLPDI